jgi:hypothetical protein
MYREARLAAIADANGARLVACDCSGRFATATVEVDVPVAPQRKWTVDLIHHSHLDISDGRAWILPPR